jgi:hypothetical protein
MNADIQTSAHRILRAIALWAYGWRRRKLKGGAAYRIEWQDPASGQWHGEKAALTLLKCQALAQFEQTARRKFDY